MSRILVLLAAAVLAGCPAFRSSARPDERDQEIIRDIKVHFLRDARFREIFVSCQGGVVTLTGRVASVQIAAEAERIAQVRDVRQILNRLEIKPK